MRLTRGYSGPMHDPAYKRIFSFPRMVKDLLRGFAGGDWIERANFSALRKVPAEYIGDDLRKRLGDSLWRLPLDEGWLHVMVLLEFQARNERDMALRILEYTAMLYRELSRAGLLGPDGLRPPVLPIVLYNGGPPWSAATDARELVAQAGPFLAPFQPSQRYLVLDLQRIPEQDLPLRNLVGALSRMERVRSLEDLRQVTSLLVEWLRAPEDGELRQAFADWLWHLAKRLLPKGRSAEAPEGLDLEDMRMTLEEMSLEERVAEWPKQWLQEGMEKGLEQGIEQGIERGLERGLEQGLEQGLERGLEQGIQRERALLRRQVALRFGAGAAEQAAQRLERIADASRLEEVGELIVRCETGGEFLARMGA